MTDRRVIDMNVGQGIAAYIDWLNRLRLSELATALDAILKNETNQMADASGKLAKAMANLDLAKMNVANIVDSNRGGDTGVHGYIAEFAEAGITNARRAFDGLRKSTIVLNDNGPVDLQVYGKDVQVKFYADLRRELEAAANYRQMDMMYAKDHMDVYRAIMNGDKEVFFNGQRLRLNQIERIRGLINEESAQRGVPWDKWMRPSKLDYDQVQKGAVGRTFEREAKDIRSRDAQRRANIKDDADKRRIAAKDKAMPNLGEAHKAAGVAAAMQAGANFATFVYGRHKEGREIWQYTADDWKACGLTSAQGALKGGFTGYAVYGLTNVCGLAAPSAGAIAAGTFGLIDAVIRLRAGEIDDDGFLSLVTVNALDATGSAVGAAVGQALIPIPVVGALIGSIAVTTTMSLGKNILTKREQELLDDYHARMNRFISELDARYARILEEMLAGYRRLGDLQSRAFDLDLNIRLRFESSIELARQAGVAEESILHDESEIDDFFLG